jgi:hypothetical protein
MEQKRNKLKKQQEDRLLKKLSFQERRQQEQIRKLIQQEKLYQFI